MWHEARKQERKIRGMLVDYKKRAERRREYYERIKQDPTQFIQIHGRACKIHLDPAVHYAAEAPGSMMPWRGDRESMIDRFDVRAHLDDIPYFDPHLAISLSPEELWEERQANYERYRILVQNEFLDIKEEKFLNQIRLEELYGPVGSRSIEEEKKALMPKKAAIGFNYNDEISGGGDDTSGTQNWVQGVPGSETAEGESGDESDSDIDLDLTVDVLSLATKQHLELNASGVEYGLNKDDFMALISRDLEEAEALRVAKEHEDEKAMYSGRKSRKERRALKKKHLDKKMSPPSYAARASPTYGPYRLSSHSKSRSLSPPCATSQIKFITTFGEESEGAASDGDESAGVIIIPEPEKNSRSGHRLDSKRHHSSASSSRRNRTHPRGSSSSRERSRSASRSRGSSSLRRRQFSRSSSSRRSRSRSPRVRKEGPKYKCSRTRRRSRSGSRPDRRSRTRSISRSRSSDRLKKIQWSRHHRSSKSRSRSPSRSRSRSRSKNSSSKIDFLLKDKNSKTTRSQDDSAVSTPPKLPSPPRRRYYGRRMEKSDSDAESGNEEEQERHSILSKGSSFPSAEESNSSFSISASTPFGNDSTSDKNIAGVKLNPKERLRKKMQALLKKQYKADKKLEKEKAEKLEQERQDREEELREIAIKLRRRERERRHRLHGEDSGSDESFDSRSPSRSPVAKVRSRDRDSPPEKELESSRTREKDIDSRRHSERSKSRERLKDRDRGDKPKEKLRTGERSWEKESSRRRESDYGRHYREELHSREREQPISRSRDYGERRDIRERSSRDQSRIYPQSSYSHSRSRPDRGSYGVADNHISDDEKRPIRLVDY